MNKYNKNNWVNQKNNIESSISGKLENIKGMLNKNQ
jgi:hypothetical protein